MNLQAQRDISRKLKVFEHAAGPGNVAFTCRYFGISREKAGLINWKLAQPDQSAQTVETGFVIVTEDSGVGMVNIHDRRPVVLEPEDAWDWMDAEIPVEEAAHIAQSKSVPTEEFMWWKVDRPVNRPDPANNGRHLLSPTG